MIVAKPSPEVANSRNTDCWQKVWRPGKAKAAGWNHLGILVTQCGEWKQPNTHHQNKMQRKKESRLLIVYMSSKGVCPSSIFASYKINRASCVDFVR